MNWSSLLTLAGILLAIGAFWTGAIVLLMARAVLRPPRMTDGKALHVLKRLSPGDLEMCFEDTVFSVRDEATGKRLRLPAWWIPHPHGGERTCILVHGYGDAKVGAIAWAPTFRALGFNILAIDLRAHGEADGTFTTAGYHERHDLAQIIDQLRAQRPGATRQLVLFGISLGAAVVAATAAMRGDIDAVVLESPYAHFVHAAATHGRLMGMPLVRWQRRVAQLAGWMAGVDFDQVAPVRLIGQIPCPLMLIHSGADPLIDPADVQALRNAVDARSAGQGPSVFWEVPGAFHVLGLQVDPALYQQTLRGFLDAALAPARPEPVFTPREA